MRWLRVWIKCIISKCFINNWSLPKMTRKIYCFMLSQYRSIIIGLKDCFSQWYIFINFKNMDSICTIRKRIWNCDTDFMLNPCQKKCAVHVVFKIVTPSFSSFSYFLFKFINFNSWIFQKWLTQLPYELIYFIHFFKNMLIVSK